MTSLRIFLHDYLPYLFDIVAQGKLIRSVLSLVILHVLPFAVCPALRVRSLLDFCILFVFDGEFMLLLCLDDGYLWDRSGCRSRRIRKSVGAINPSRQSPCRHSLCNNLHSPLHTSSRGRRFPDPPSRRHTLWSHYHSRLPLWYVFPQDRPFMIRCMCLLIIWKVVIYNRCRSRRLWLWLPDWETSSFSHESPAMQESRHNLVARSLPLVPSPHPHIPSKPSPSRKHSLNRQPSH